MTTTHVDDLSTWAVKLHVTKSGKSVTGFVKKRPIMTNLVTNRTVFGTDCVTSLLDGYGEEIKQGVPFQRHPAEFITLTRDQ